MGIINRSKDTSEQKEMYKVVEKTQVNANEAVVFVAPRACTITDAKSTVFGISGAPTVMLRGSRFIAGTGGSTFNIGSTLAIPAFGISAYGSLSLPASGSTLLNLQKGDVVTAIFGGGTGAASTSAVVEVIVQNTQDIKTWF